MDLELTTRACVSLLPLRAPGPPQQSRKAHVVTRMCCEPRGTRHSSPRWGGPGFRVLLPLPSRGRSAQGGHACRRFPAWLLL